MNKPAYRRTTGIAGVVLLLMSLVVAFGLPAVANVQANGNQQCYLRWRVALDPQSDHGYLRHPDCRICISRSGRGGKFSITFCQLALLHQSGGRGHAPRCV